MIERFTRDLGKLTPMHLSNYYLYERIRSDACVYCMQRDDEQRREAGIHIDLF